MTVKLTIHRTYFLVDEIYEGDYYNAPNTFTRTTEWVLSARDAAREIQSEGLTFAATGGNWAANPDGSYTVNYATGQECEVSAHLEGPDRLVNAIASVVG